MNEPTEYDITDAMMRYGGGFVSMLGELYRRADEINKRKIREAFPEIWAEYSELALLKQKNHGRTP